MKLRGIIPPVVTPFTPDEELDLPRLREHIDWQLSRGVHGIFVLGTTSEFYALDETEKQTVVAAAVAHVNSRRPVFAGTGAETTREVVRLTRMAEKEGADGVSVITPYFIKPTQAELLDHFRRVAESTKLAGRALQQPVHVRRAVHRAGDGGEAGRGAEHRRHQGLAPATCRTRSRSSATRRGRSSRCSTAATRSSWRHCSSGRRGAIPASCNIAPDLCVGIYEAFQKGDIAGGARNCNPGCTRSAWR